MALPAASLSVAKVMSAVSIGFNGVSRALTKSPASLAWRNAAFTALPLLVIRMPLSPRAIAV